MAIYLETGMVGLIALGALVWLVKIWKQEGKFPRSDKFLALGLLLGFLLSFFRQAGSWPGAVLSVAGTVISQFLCGILFFENYREVEIPYE